ncbi:MAG: hypothetical protein WBV39_12135 [Rudaea sp.]
MYPVLMAADILAFNATHVPVGRDQVQHIEMARDIGQRFNHIYDGDYFTVPEAAIEENVATLPGLDGRKMSKSYNNTIPLWLSEKHLRQAILGIVTNSQGPGEPKDPDASHLFSIFQAFASAAETSAMRQAFADGIGWGEAKQKVFERINAELAPMRERYEALIAKPDDIEVVLRTGAGRARQISAPFVERLRRAVGLRALNDVQQSPKQFTESSTKIREGRFVGPFPIDGKFQFRLESAARKAIFLSRKFPTRDEAIAKLKQMRAPGFARPSCGQLYMDDENGSVVDIRDARTNELLGTVRLYSNPVGIGIDVLMEQIAALG